ncbi:MAG TPA: hypothetical protein VKW09_00900 [bacterium]|nr:hypothetical protein [bacterium]
MRVRLWLMIAVVAALLTPVAWYLGSPLFINRVVDEPFPSTAAPAAAPAEQVSR